MIPERIAPSLVSLNTSIRMIEETINAARPRLQACYLAVDNAQEVIDKNISAFED